MRGRGEEGRGGIRSWSSALVRPSRLCNSKCMYVTPPAQPPHLIQPEPPTGRRRQRRRRMRHHPSAEGPGGPQAAGGGGRLGGSGRAGPGQVAPRVPGRVGGGEGAAAQCARGEPEPRGGGGGADLVLQQLLLLLLQLLLLLLQLQEQPPAARLLLLLQQLAVRRGKALQLAQEVGGLWHNQAADRGGP